MVKDILLWIRKEDNKRKKIYLFFLSSFISTILNIIFDYLKINNWIKSIFVGINAFSIFSLVYLVSNERFKILKRKDENYISLKEKLSYRQRVNLSLLIILPINMTFVLFIPNTFLLYSVIASLILALNFFLAVFIFKTPHEKRLEKENIEDIRDLEEDFKKIDKIYEKIKEDKN